MTRLGWDVMVVTATGLVAKFLKTRQLETELVATSCNWFLTYIG